MGPRTDNFFCDIANRAAPIPHRNYKSRKIVDAAKKDGPKKHPEESRKPAPNHSDCRAEDWTEAGYRGEMVAKKHRLLGRDVVDAVGHGVCRCFSIGV